MQRMAEIPLSEKLTKLHMIGAGKIKLELNFYYAQMGAVYTCEQKILTVHHFNLQDALNSDTC